MATRSIWSVFLAAWAALAPALAVAQTTPNYRSWFLAEGSTQASFEEQILIANPGAAAASVTLTFLGSSGPLIPAQTVSVGPASRATVDLRALVAQFPALAGSPVSVRIDSTQDIVVERTMYWSADVSGQPVPRRSAHNATGTLRAARQWYLAEGATQSIFDTYILISNATDQDATVDVTFSRSDANNLPLGQVTPRAPGGGPLTVRANSRLTLGALRNGDLVSDAYPAWPGLIGPGVSFSTVVSSNVDIVVERAMYWNRTPLSLWEGGTGSVGVTQGASTWYLAEGFTGYGPGGVKFDSYLLLFNTGGTSTRAEVTFLRSKVRDTDPVPPPIVCTYTLQPGERRTIWVNRDVDRTLTAPACGPADPLAEPREMDNVSFSVRVTSQPDPIGAPGAPAQPLIVERAMYWGTMGPGLWVEGHNTPGVTAEATRWAFAEGAMDVDTFDTTPGQRYSSYFLVANSRTTPLRVRATFFREDGFGIVREYDVAARSRFTIAPTTIENVTDPQNLPANREDLRALSNQRFAVVLEAIDDPATTSVNEAVPFVAERAVYWGPDWFGGTSSPGVPWPTAAVTPPAPPAPTVTAITPNSGAQTTTTPVTITGAEFAQGATVTVNGVAATNVVVVNATTITAVVPPGTTSGAANVVVVSRGVTVATTTLFTYVPPPTITRVTPDEGRSLGGEIVEVQGTTFVPLPGTTPIVSFGNRAAVVQPAPAPTSTSVFVRTPANPAGLVNVTVFVNGQTATRVGAFRYYPFSSTDNILAFGDSITFGIYRFIDDVTGLPVFPPTDGGYPARLDALLDTFYAPRETFTVTNAGVPGECVAGPLCGLNPTSGVGRLPTTSGTSTPDDLVIILEGTNDIGIFTAAEIVTALDTMVGYALGAGKKVVLCTLVPKDNTAIDAALAAEVSQAIRNLKNTKYGSTANVVLVDLHATFPLSGLANDGIHPTPQGYAFMAQKFFEAIRASFETR